MTRIFISLLLFISFGLSAQDCHLGELQITILDCNDQGQFNISVNFTHENTGNDGFSVSGNGNNYGIFQYGSLPVIIGPFAGNGTTVYELHVQDVQKADCVSNKTFGPVQCNNNSCHIYDLVVDALDCTSDSTYSASVNFFHDNTGNAGFSLYYNNSFWAIYDYADLPLLITNLPESGNNNNVIKVSDNQFQDCTKTKEFAGLHCGNSGGGDCHLSDMTATVSPCDSNGKFFVTINFNHQNTGTNGFTIHGNGTNYGNFSYDDLPVTLGPLMSNQSQNWEFVAIDLQHELCRTDTQIGIVDCNDECEIFDWAITPLECTSDSTYAVKINFHYNDYPDSLFWVYGNGKYLGEYKLNKLPVTILNFPEGGSNIDTITICAPDTIANCCHSKTYEGLHCPVMGDCHILELNVTEMSCTSDSTYTGTINFATQNTSGAGFDVWVNNQYFGTYPYASIPLTIPNMPSNGSLGDLLKVCDHEFQDCCKAKEFQGPACGSNNDCNIVDLNVTDMTCTSDSTYSGIIHFVNQNTSGAGFDLWINNHYFGTYAYSAIPLTITNMPSNGTAGDIIKVCDHEFQDCCKTKEFQGPACSGTGDCHILELNVTEMSCTSDSTYKGTINFIHQNTSGAGFDLWINNHYFGTYAYSSIPLTLTNIPSNGTAGDLIKVCDHEFQDCCKAKEFQGPACGGGGNCELYNLTVVVGDCNSDNTYHLTVNFQQQNPGSNKFDLFANNVFFGTYFYSQLPLTIPNFPKSGNSHDVVRVCDHELADCCRTKEFESPSCSSGDCHLYDLTVTTVECTSSSTYKVIVNFQHQYTMSDHFDLYANGVYFGYYAYSQLPLTITNFPASGNPVDHIKVSDNDNAGCNATKEFAALNCTTQDCSIHELSVNLGDCASDTTYSITINFIVQNPGSTKFDVFANGNYFGTYFYTQLPLTIPNFPDSGNNNDVVKVCDHELADCCKSKEFSSPNCANGAPDIYDIQAEVFNCIGIKFSVKIGFNYKNPGNNGFKIEGNGNDYGSFDYSQLPVTLGGLNADNVTAYEFTVVDNDFPEANDYMYLGTVKCTTSTFDPKSGEVPFIYYFNGEDLVVRGKELIEFSGVNAFDIMGRQLYSDNANSSQYVINTGNWIPGNYILFVQTKTGQSSVLINKSK